MYQLEEYRMFLYSSVIGFSDLWTILSFTWTVLVVITVVVVIAERREPVNTLAWIMVITMFPVGGVILFLILGQNHRRQRTFMQKELYDSEAITRLCNEQLHHIAHPDRATMPNRNFVRLMLNNSRALLTEHNRVRILNNGEQTFPDMFEEMSKAERYIHIEFFAIEGGVLFDRLVEILDDRIAHGVEVRIIYDSVGSRRLRRRELLRLRAIGAEVRSFMPVWIARFTDKVNYRNHRKIVVIDGRVGYTGGVNIADRYIDGVRGGIWRDTHLRIEGEAVAMLQSVFVTDWHFVTDGCMLSDEVYFHTQEVSDVLPIQIATSGPDSPYASIMQAYFAAIGKAERYIYVSTPYLLPNQAIVTALRVAALSGVDVRVLIPVRGDNIFVAWAGYSYVDSLMEAGVKVYLYNKGFNHSKFLLIDDCISSIGSANLDNRSFEDDFEVQAIIYDGAITEELKGYFMEDLARSTEITPEMWRSRPRLSKIMEPIARLLAPLF